MDSGAAFRRAFHLASPIFLGYYLLPESVAPGITRVNVTLLFLGTAWCIEIGRISLGLRMFGMRTYEGQRVSAYAQGSVGLAFAVFIIQEPRIVVPVFVGMAWIDPLAALARRSGWSIAVPGVAYASVFLFAILAVGNIVGLYPWFVAILFTTLATGTAMLVEGPRIPSIDDDLLMQVVPMVVLTGAGLGLGYAGLL